MRELVGRASFGHIRSVVKPVLHHLDNHNLWLSNRFAVHTFKVIMFSIQVATPAIRQNPNIYTFLSK
jgi:protein EFR3